MERGENPIPTSLHQDTPNPDPEMININIEIDVRLRSVRILIQDLRNTREPLWLSLATSLDTIVSSITNSQS